MNEEFDSALRNAVWRYAHDEFDRLARSVRHRLQRWRAPNALGEPALTNFWDQYCFEQQNGPSYLRSAFEQDALPHIQFVREGVPARKAALLTLGAPRISWHLDDEVYPELIVPEVLDQEIELSLNELANFAQLERHARSSSGRVDR